MGILLNITMCISQNQEDCIMSNYMDLVLLNKYLNHIKVFTLVP